MKKELIAKSRQSILIIALSIITLACFSQTKDSIKIVHHFSGTVNITNNGISLVPSFSLGKPAVLALMSLGGQRFSFDPDIRFSLEGKPWTFLFWARYNLFTEGKFRMNTGAHLGLNFRTTTIDMASVPTESIVVRRYLAMELAPNYFVAPNISIGSYYLYSHGIDPGAVKNTHFITLNSIFYHISIYKQYYLRVIPQVYYLSQDGKDGYYFTSTITAAKQNFPLSVSSIINKQLRSNVRGTKDFIWNVSLVYSFNKIYSKPAIL